MLYSGASNSPSNHSHTGNLQFLLIPHLSDIFCSKLEKVQLNSSHKDNPSSFPILRSITFIASVKSLLPSNITYSQTLEIGAWISLEKVNYSILPPPPKYVSNRFKSVFHLDSYHGLQISFPVSVLILFQSLLIEYQE